MKTLKTFKQLLQGLVNSTDRLTTQGADWEGLRLLNVLQYDVADAYKGHSIGRQEYEGLNHLVFELMDQYREKLRP